jgi:hypothetical protein
MVRERREKLIRLRVNTPQNAFDRGVERANGLAPRKYVAEVEDFRGEELDALRCFDQRGLPQRHYFALQQFRRARQNKARVAQLFDVVGGSSAAVIAE